MSESRLHKSYLNARVNVFFYLVTLFISFFSRKIFLEKLGADFVGLTSTMQNLLGFLNLAELGIGASIGYVCLLCSNKKTVVLLNSSDY